jgi:hypothetical protein
MRASRITARPPNVVPLTIEWSDNVWVRNEESIIFYFGNRTQQTLLDVGINIVNRSESTPIQFRIFTTDGVESVFELKFDGNQLAYTRISGQDLHVKYGRRTLTLQEWFETEPPTIRFHDGQQLTGDLLITAPETSRPYDKTKIEVWDWSNTDIQNESQGAERKPRSIQRKVIRTLLEDSDEFAVVFDDDGSNESADVVALRVSEKALTVKLFHCKFAFKGQVRNAVADLYELCGQAQRSVHWKADRFQLIDHLIRRENLRQKRGSTRFERGSYQILRDIKKQMKYLDIEMDVTLVHPGVSKGGLSDGQLDLLATTQLYLSETYEVPMYLIINE